MTEHGLKMPPPPPSLISKAKRNWNKTIARAKRKKQDRQEAGLAGGRGGRGAGAPDTETTAATRMEQNIDAMMHHMEEEEDSLEPATNIDAEDIHDHHPEVTAMQERLSQAEQALEQQQRDLQTTQRLLQEATVLNEAMSKKWISSTLLASPCNLSWHEATSNSRTSNPPKH